MKIVLLGLVGLLSVNCFAAPTQLPVESFKIEMNVWFKIKTQDGEIKDCFVSYLGREKLMKIDCINPPKQIWDEIKEGDWPEDGPPRDMEKEVK